MKIPKQSPKLPQLLAKLASKLAHTLDPDSPYWEFGKRAEAKYWPWDKVRYIAQAENLDPELAWLAIKTSRYLRYQPLDLHGSAGQQLCYTLQAKLQQQLMRIDQQLAGDLGSPEDRELSPSQKERFILQALHEEAIMSSMLEGAVTTRREAQNMLRSGRQPRTTGERMIANNYEAITFIRDHKHTELSPEFIIEIQTILTTGTEDDDVVGRFRTDNDNIVVATPENEVIHTPPPADELPERIAKLCTFANNPDAPDHFIHPVLKACTLHFQIGYDHPFCDGNGRTARAIFYWMMLRSGYWLFEYLPISRLIYKSASQYYKAYLYTENDDFDLTYFFRYKLRQIERAQDELQAHIRQKQYDMAEARRVFAGDTSLNHRQREIVLRFMKNSDAVMTIGDHQSRSNIAYDTARNDLLDLEAKNYLSRVVIGNRYEFVPGKKLTDLHGKQSLPLRRIRHGDI